MGRLSNEEMQAGKSDLIPVSQTQFLSPFMGTLPFFLIHYPMLRITVFLLCAFQALSSWAQSPAAVGKALTEQLNKTVYLTSSQKTQVEPIFTKAMAKMNRIQAADEADYQRQRNEILTRMDAILAGSLSDTQAYRYKKARQSGAFRIPDPRRRRQARATRPQTVSRNGTTMQQGQARQRQHQQQQTQVQQPVAAPAPAAPQPAVPAPASVSPASTPTMGSGFTESESTPAEETWEEESYEEESYEEETWDEGDSGESYDEGMPQDSASQQHMLLKSSDFVVDEMLNLDIPTDSAALDSMGKGKILLKKAGRFIYDEVVKPSVEKKIEADKAKKAKAKEGNGGS